MRRIYILITIFVGALFSSCDDYVDIVPKGSAIAENLEDVDALLDYAMILSGDLGNNNAVPFFVNDNIHVSEEDVQTLEASWFRHYASIYRLDDRFYLSNEKDRSWEDSYKCISSCNYILQITPDMEGNETTKNHYIGEALTHRAHAYFRLVNTFGHHYGLPQASEEESGVPIISEYGNQDEFLVRNSVNEVYDEIVGNLTDAIPKLQTGRPFVDRVNKSAAQALLARVYLHMGMYTEALEQANAALSYNSELVDYDALTGAPSYGADNPEYILLKEVSYPNVGSYYTGYKGLGRYSEELVVAFDKPTMDLRLLKLADLSPDGNFVLGLNSPSSHRSVIGVTVPEVMLIKAECIARTGTPGDAVDVINALREKRFTATDVAAGNHEVSASNQQEAIDLVINERRLEFHVTGMRFFDIKRLNALHNAGISLTRGSVTWAPNSINWAIPIGENVIETGKGQIKQNPRE